MKKWAGKSINILAYIGLAIIIIMLMDHFLEVARDVWNNPF